MTTDCPNNDTLRQLCDGSLPANQESAITAHIDQCARCQAALEGFHTQTDVAANLGGKALAHDSDLLRRKLAELKKQRPQPAVSRRDWLADIAPWLDPEESKHGIGRIAEFELTECVGRGGMGVVFRARDAKLHRDVALKLMAPGLLADPNAAKRFLREARSAASINHPSVVTIHSVAQMRQIPYLVMELVEGESLQRRLASGPLPMKSIVNIARQVAEGLTAAHAADVVHRDIKPANILLKRDSDLVKLTDFGLARLGEGSSFTQTGLLVGTPEFIAPEQFDANLGTIDHRADLFSLGSVIYTMCTGKVPFSGPTVLTTLNAICTSKPKPIEETRPDTPAWICDLVRRLHEKDPDRRPQTASEVASALARAAATNLPPPVAAPAPVIVAARKPTVARTKRQQVPWSIVILAASLLCVIGLLFWMTRPGDDAPAQATSQPDREASPPARTASQPDQPSPRVSIDRPPNEPRLALTEPDQEPDSQLRSVSNAEELLALIEDSDGETTIELQWSGVSQLPPCEIEQRDLTLVAGDDQTPSLAIAPSRLGIGIAIIDCQIRLEGVALESKNPRLIAEDDDRAFIVVDGGTFAAENCKFVAADETTCFRLEGCDAHFTSCELRAHESTVIDSQLSRTSELHVANSVLIGETNLSFEGAPGREIDLENNSFFGTFAIEVYAGEEFEGNIKLIAERNVFDSLEACLMIDVVEFDEDVRWNELVRWRGRQNAFPEQLVVMNDEDGEERQSMTDLERWTQQAIDEVDSFQAAPPYLVDRREILDRFDEGKLGASDLGINREERWQNLGADSTGFTRPARR